jgi:hypothetical protein
MDQSLELSRPRPRRDGIPTSEPGSLRRVVRRTTILRIALALALVATLTVAFLLARRSDVRHAPLVPSGTTGVVVLDLSASVYESAFGPTLRKMASQGERAGLVVFSDQAYEVLPPGSPGRELLSYLRLFAEGENSTTGTFPPNPWQDFRAGTRISAGIRAARESLERAHSHHGSVLLISDLEILPDEVIALGDEVAALGRAGIDLRVLPVSPSDEARHIVEQITGKSAFLKGDTQTVRKAPDEKALRLAAPWWFMLAAAAVVVLLALNEHRLSRLEVKRR